MQNSKYGAPPDELLNMKLRMITNPSKGPLNQKDKTLTCKPASLRFQKDLGKEISLPTSDREEACQGVCIPPISYHNGLLEG